MVPRKIEVLEDNEGAIALAENPLSSCGSKHIDVRHHFLRNLTEEGVIEIACGHPHEGSAERSF